METKIKRKFIFTSTLSAVIMLLLVVLSLNIMNFISMNSSADYMISLIEDNNGKLPTHDIKEKPPLSIEFLPPQLLFSTQYSIVYFDDQNQILYSNTSSDYSEMDTDIQEYAKQLLFENGTSGYIDNHKYLKTEIDNQNAIIFLDCSRELEMFRTFLYNTLLIATAAVILVLIISYFISPIALKPILSAYEKQKKFITNASHELKTPLTVIYANMDFLEMSMGDNQSINNSKEQVVKLTDLVNSLVDLARIEENQVMDKTDILLSKMAEMVAESYASVALMKEKSFYTEIESDILYKGNEKNISQLFYILLDNAFKYSNKNGIVKLTLSNKQDKIIISVWNTVDVIEKGKHKEFFDRFYRKDESRNSKNYGFGIGLSIAKSIVTSHKGKITALSDDGKSISLQVIL